MTGFQRATAGKQTITVNYEECKTTFEINVSISGTCGENLTWAIDDAGTLTISGSGEMTKFETFQKAPWIGWCYNIKSIVITENVTSISQYAFYDYWPLNEVTILGGVTNISKYAFYDCSLSCLTLPASVTKIEPYAFHNCKKLTDVFYSGTAEQWSEIYIMGSNESLKNATLHCHAHSYETTTVSATCTVVGYTDYICACGDSYREEILALGHSFVNYVSDGNATCTADGTKTAECDRCEATDTVTDTGSKRGHDHSVTVSTTAPDCTQQGSTVKKCSRCDSTETTYTDALGHNMVIVPAVAPTCTETGLTAGTACDRCGEIGTAQTEVPATGHNYVNGVCSGCGDISNVNAPQVVVDTVESGAGKTVSVSISLKNNPGLVTMQLQVEYDSTVLTLKQVQDNGLLGSTIHNPTLGSPYTLRWANNTAAADFTANGAVVTLIFEISEDAEEGYCPITVSYDYDNYDIMNWNMDAVKFDVVNGGVEIVNVIIGDVDGNGSVNNRDSMVLDRYLAKWPGYTEENVDLKAADVNGDGVVNNKDSMILARYLAKWSGYETLPYAR